MKGEGGKTSAHLKCVYTNAHSMGNKQEELEAMMKQENYDVVAVTETWWDVSHDWSVPVDGYKLFRRDRQGRRGGGVALYVRDCYDCFKHKYSEDRVECLCVRIRGRPKGRCCSRSLLEATHPGQRGG